MVIFVQPKGIHKWSHLIAPWALWGAGIGMIQINEFALAIFMLLVLSTGAFLIQIYTSHIFPSSIIWRRLAKTGAVISVLLLNGFFSVVAYKAKGNKLWSTLAAMDATETPNAVKDSAASSSARDDAGKTSPPSKVSEKLPIPIPTAPQVAIPREQIAGMPNPQRVAKPEQQNTQLLKDKRPVVQGRVDWRDKQNWRKLMRIGMTRTEVRALFGEPDEMSVIQDSELWNYIDKNQAGLRMGMIHFVMREAADGSLYSWHEP
jgi:hypothetical protein